MNAGRTSSPSGNRTLSSAKTAKQDEFYTQYVDIQKEVAAYLEFDPDTFRGKVVYCNCDDPAESNFFKYFAESFTKLGLKELITTSYAGSPIAERDGQLILPSGEESGDERPPATVLRIREKLDLPTEREARAKMLREYLAKNPGAGAILTERGAFQSAECVALLKQADIVVTNPPFSLFREYVAQLVKHDKKFLIIASKNATTYKEIFPLIKENKLWMGAGFSNGNAFFSIPSGTEREFADGVYDKSTGLVKFRNVGWFTNLEHNRRHQILDLMTMEENLRFSKHKELRGKAAYDRYDNYDAIEVPFTDAIPSDYDGVMGVPITFLDKYNPDQFEIVGGSSDGYSAAALGVTPLGPEYVGNVGRTKLGNPSTKRAVYKRILIRHRRPQPNEK